MNCHVSKGDRPVKISWNFNGSPLPSNLGITTQKLGERSSVLTISNVMGNHNGEYTCIAKNAAGVVNYTTSVHINGTIEQTYYRTSFIYFKFRIFSSSFLKPLPQNLHLP